VLSNFPGTILLVSHDRYLIDSLSSQIWEVDPHGQVLHVFKGSYTQYKTHKMKMQDAQSAKEIREKDGADADASRHAVQKRTPDKALSNYERRKIKARLEEIEEEIPALEAQQARVSDQLETPPEDPDEVLRLGEAYVGLQKQIEDLMMEWAALEEKLVG